MSTSQNKWLSLILRYNAAVILVAVFGGVYELFSHQVYSFFMIYAFLIPLVFGELPALIAAKCQARYPGGIGIAVYASALACFCAGCLFAGILEIYGTTSHLLWIYFAAGALLAVFSLICFVLSALQTHRHRLY